MRPLTGPPIIVWTLSNDSGHKHPTSYSIELLGWTEPWLPKNYTNKCMKEWTFFFCLHPFPFTPASKQNLQHHHWVLSFISVLFLTVSLQPGRGMIISPVCWRWVRSLSLSFRSIPNYLTLPALCSFSVASSALREKPQILHIRHSWSPSTLAL